MLSSVVDQCLSLALASASKQVGFNRMKTAQRRMNSWQAPLASYPRLQAALAKAQADGVVSSRRRFSDRLQ
ncbi:hypothetical protein [Lichenifustis flavocetrariae]|uniref:Uncharacterized protein n=1 Tax=Lichenifustis flavocetrariae TaxID=2949735 RepID=A0AA41Z0J6_9HYPH|nr:hypothetical protein [Lichenifustis flavocetrariae]MCW6510558.1 hypothetical protein [Lichenifustis flavocetrariae]